MRAQRGSLWTGLRAGFSWVRQIDRVDVFVLGGIALIGWGVAQSDLGLAAIVVGGLLTLIGVSAAKTR